MATEKAVLRVLTSQPADWIDAFKIQATRNGQSLSEFLGDCGVKSLDSDLRKKLGARPGRGPVKKAKR